MSEVPVTTEQVHELIQQLAAMNVAASITPEIVANIFENIRQLNDQEREKVIAVAEAYIEEILNTNIPASKVSYKGGTLDEKLDKMSSETAKVSSSVEEGGNLDLSDPDGYVIVRFSGGHVKTKYFDSRNIPSISVEGTKLIIA